jgi:TolA-binding protein
MNKKIGFLLILFLFLNSCTSITLLRIKELKEIEKKIDSLKTELTAQQELLLKEQKSQNELLRLTRADMQVRFEEIDQKISALENSILESKQKLSIIDKKTQEIQEQWKNIAASESLSVAQKKAQIEKLYQIAFQDFSASRYDLAANGFLDLINQYPESEMADEANYWYAECFLAKKDYNKAEQLFTDYLRKYRDGKKMCASLYKLGLIFDAKKMPDKKKLVWQKLLSTCPQSQEAIIVKDKIKN